MHLFWQVSLLAGLMPYLSRAADSTTLVTMDARIRADVPAPTANLGIWTIDASCTNYHDPRTGYVWGKKGGKDQTALLQDMLTIALQAATAAQDALKFALGKRPSAAADKAGCLKWIRISQSILVTLGIFPKVDQVESATDPHWKDAFKVIDNMVATLKASKNNPEHGYNTELSKLTRAKPLFACGDNWEWFDKDEEMPDYGFESLEFVRNMDNAAGSWYKHHRFVVKEKKQDMPVLCDGTTLGYTSAKWDIIVLCDRVLANAGTKSDWPSADKITEGYRLADLEEGAQQAIIHELLHWFGGVEDHVDYKTVVTDIQRVNEDGYLVYIDEDDNEVYKADPLDEDEQKAAKLTAEASYAIVDVWHLARTHTGETAANTGPAKAIANAQSLAVFLTMMYYDEWNWAVDDTAKKATQVYTG